MHDASNDLRQRAQINYYDWEIAQQIQNSMFYTEYVYQTRHTGINSVDIN